MAHWNNSPLPTTRRLAAGTLTGLALLLFAACEQLEPEPAFADEPLIELLSVSSDTLVQFTDQLVLRIRYQDGDGDLGHPDPDINSFFVKDQRLEVADEYYLGPLAPEDAAVPIQGELDLVLSRTFILGNAQTETTVFTVYLVDRAGNESNTIETGAITLVRE